MRRSSVTRRIAQSAVLAGLIAACASAQAVIFVDDDAPLFGDGRSWPTAYRYLQDALSAADAVLGDSIEIRVAEGTYCPDRSALAPDGTRARESRFLMRSRVAVRGGYAGLTARGTVRPDDRDPQAYPTVLSGDLNGDDSPDFANTAENAFQVVVALHVDDTAILDGVVVSGARADGPGHGPVPESLEQGGAVNIYFSQPTLMDCVFEKNWMLNHGTVNDHGDATLIRCVFRDNFAQAFGAGLYVHHHSRTQAIECRFENNETPAHGGGAYSRSGAVEEPHRGHEEHWARFTGCVFVGNRADRGAGLYNAPGSRSHIEDCLFMDNVAGNLGGGTYCSEMSAPELHHNQFHGNTALTGGGLYAKDCLPHIEHCHFEANTADTGDGGGGAWLEEAPGEVLDCEFIDNVGFNGGGLYNGGFACPVVRDCVFRGNIALNDNGGGMSNVNCGPVVENCLFENNAATTNSDNLFVVGGGIASYLASPVLIGCRFRNNTALRGGGGVFQEGGVGYLVNCILEDNEAFSGGGVYVLRTTLHLFNCVLVGNRAAGGDVFNSGGAAHNSFDATLTLNNCTIFDNHAEDAAGALAAYTSTFTDVRDSVLWGNGPEQVLPGADAVISMSYNLVEGGWSGDGVDNRDLDPRFVDAGARDLRLAPGSPAIDTGDPEYVAPSQSGLDAGGAARIANCLVDRGAYEFEQPTQRGDINLDGTIDGRDIGAFVDTLLSGGLHAVVCRADINSDGYVGMSDIGPFIQLLIP